MQFQERKRWLFFGLPFTFTTYRVTEEYITVKSGLLRQKEDDCYMYKIVDTRLVRSLPERFFGLGTVECFGGDTTDPVLHLKALPFRLTAQELLLEPFYSHSRSQRNLLMFFSSALLLHLFYAIVCINYMQFLHCFQLVFYFFLLFLLFLQFCIIVFVHFPYVFSCVRLRNISCKCIAMLFSLL